MAGKLKIGLGVIVVLAVLWFGFTFTTNWTYSEGDRVGQVVKLSRKGIFFKTWEGEMNLGGFAGQKANTWEFSVVNTEAIQELEKSQDTGGWVKIHYEQKLFRVPWRGATDYFAIHVHPVKERPQVVTPPEPNN